MVSTGRLRGYEVLLLTDDEGPEGLEHVVRSSVADALIVMDGESEDPRIPMLLASDQPVVPIGTPTYATAPASVVLADWCQRIRSLGRQPESLPGLRRG